MALTAPSAMQSLIGGIDFEIGRSYLVSASDGVDHYCGFSGSDTPSCERSAKTSSRCDPHRPHATSPTRRWAACSGPSTWHTSVVPWLVTDDARVLASAEIADARSARRRGLLGRDHLDGAIVLRPCRWIHTIGLRFPIDVAFLDDDGVVVKTMQMHQRRIGVPVWRASLVVEAEAGAFARWGLRVGDTVEVRDDDT